MGLRDFKVGDWVDWRDSPGEGWEDPAARIESMSENYFTKVPFARVRWVIPAEMCSQANPNPAGPKWGRVSEYNLDDLIHVSPPRVVPPEGIRWCGNSSCCNGPIGPNHEEWRNRGVR